jgi:hypothetical protein
MPRKPSIDPDTGKALFAAYRRLGTVAAAAREVGVSESAARRYFAETPKAATPIIASQRQILETAGASLWDTRQALEQNYGRALTLLGQLEQGILEERQGSDGPYTTMTPIATHVAALREVREHIQAGLKLYQLLISVDETRKFREAVLEAIREADEPTQQRIIAKLQDRRSLELAL